MDAIVQGMDGECSGRKFEKGRREISRQNHFTRPRLTTEQGPLSCHPLNPCQIGTRSTYRSVPGLAVGLTALKPHHSCPHPTTPRIGDAQPRTPPLTASPRPPPPTRSYLRILPSSTAQKEGCTAAKMSPGMELYSINAISTPPHQHSSEAACRKMMLTESLQSFSPATMGPESTLNTTHHHTSPP